MTVINNRFGGIDASKEGYRGVTVDVVLQIRGQSGLINLLGVRRFVTNCFQGLQDLFNFEIFFFSQLIRGAEVILDKQTLVL